MPDWRRLVRERLSGLRVPAADEIGLVEELAQHLDDRYRELVVGGRSEDDALRASLDEIDGTDFVHAIEDSLDGKSDAS